MWIEKPTQLTNYLWAWASIGYVWPWTSKWTSQVLVVVITEDLFVGNRQPRRQQLTSVHKHILLITACLFSLPQLLLQQVSRIVTMWLWWSGVVEMWMWRRWVDWHSVFWEYGRFCIIKNIMRYELTAYIFFFCIVLWMFLHSILHALNICMMLCFNIIWWLVFQGLFGFWSCVNLRSHLYGRFYRIAKPYIYIPFA